MTRNGPPRGAARWWHGARPRTLGAGVVPVAMGTALAQHIVAWRVAATFVVAVAIQVGVNYANDYFDGVRGVDTAERRGPVRLVASGLASPRAVAIAAGVAFAIAAVAGIALAAAVTWWFLAVGAAALLAATLYSGGPKPYASLGLGEISVFVFFGLVAVAGTVYAHDERIPAGAWWLGVATGLLSVAILVANNLRDIPTDSAAGKRTLAVRMGERATRALYRMCVAAGVVAPAAGAIAGALPAWTAVSVAALGLAARPLRDAGSASGAALVPVLVETARVQWMVGALVTAALLAAR